MPASNSLNYANGFEIKVVGGEENSAMKSSGRLCTRAAGGVSSLATLLLTQAKILPHCVVNTKKRVFNKLGD